MCKGSNRMKVTGIVALHILNQKVFKKKKEQKRKGFGSLQLMYYPQLRKLNSNLEDKGS